jgi:hypothetical protein
MQRNNNVFLFGFISESKQGVLRVDGENTEVLDLLVQTDRPEKGGVHRVFVTGRQAAELRQFMQASENEPLEIAVLGWLHSSTEAAVVMASRVTAVVPQAIRKTAIKAIKQEGIPPS